MIPGSGYVRGDIATYKSLVPEERQYQDKLLLLSLRSPSDPESKERSRAWHLRARAIKEYSRG